MTPAYKKAFEFGPLTKYPLKDRLSIRLGSFLIFLVLAAIGRTLRFELDDEESLDEIFDGFDSPIICSYHDRLITGVAYLRGRGTIAMVSNSRDGELASRIAHRFGFGVVRGSSSRGGRRALHELAEAMLRGGIAFLTVDGPRGPRHKAKPGAVLLARMTGKSIVPAMLQPEKCWTLRSWDRMIIPKPFSRVVTMKGEPIFVPANADPDMIASKLAELQNGIDGLLDRCDAYFHHSS